MKDEEFDEFALLNKEKERIKSLQNPLKDLDFRYHIFLDFLILEIISLCFALFMLGIKDIFGEIVLNRFYDKIWYTSLIFAFLIIVEIILTYIFFKKLVQTQSKILAFILYGIFILFFCAITIILCLNSVITCIFFEGLLSINILSFIVMNSIKAFEDKNIIKLFVLYINTFIVIILYIVFVNKRYIIFFILATSSVLYFSYLIHYYKRLIVTNFTHLLTSFTFDKTKKEFVLSENSSEFGNSNNLNDNDEQKYDKEILSKCSISMLTKISFIASFADTTVFNFS